MTEIKVKWIGGQPTHPSATIDGHYQNVRRLYYRKGDKFIPLKLFYHEKTDTIISHEK